MKYRPFERVVYQAANLHLMTVYADESGNVISWWDASHADECKCEGESLPDW